jgi:hypothetical protein
MWPVNYKVMPSQKHEKAKQIEGTFSRLAQTMGAKAISMNFVPGNAEVNSLWQGYLEI